MQPDSRESGRWGKLYHLPLSISTWHLGRALDKVAAYPCGQPSPSNGASFGLVALAVGSFSLFPWLCFLTVHPIPGISSGKLGSSFSVPDSFPSRKEALHPVAFKWIFNVSL